MKSNKIAIAVFIALFNFNSFAAGPAIGADSVLSMMESAMAPAINKLVAQALIWLGVFGMLQFVITNYRLLKSDGDIQVVIAKTAGSVAWLGVCIYIINNGPQFIGAVGNQMFGLLGLTLPTPGSIIASTIAVVASLAALAVGVGGVGIIGSTTAGMLLVYILLFILAIGMFFAFKIFMIQLELGLIVMLSPLSFSFLGLDALKDQGIAPFKALISLAYRIILLTVILSAFTEVGNVASAALSDVTLNFITNGIGKAMSIVLSALGAYFMLAYLVYKSDSIAATLASGSTSMGTGDIASAAAAGAAAGAAVASGGAAAAAAGTNVPQSMSSFMRGLGGGGSVSNASSLGAGGAGSLPGASPPLASRASGQDYPLNGSGAPIPPEGSEAPAQSFTSGPDLDAAASTPAGSSSPGSGSNAGIAGESSQSEKKLDKVLDHLASKPGNSKTFRDHLSNANHHVAQEKAATHIAISTHQSD
jgi:type IV secretion system protein TrbL